MFALIVNIFTKYIYSYMNNTAVLQFGCHRDDPLSVCVCVCVSCVIWLKEKFSREIAIVSFNPMISRTFTIALNRRQTLLVGMARSLLKISSISALLGAESAIFDVLSTYVTIKLWDAWRKLVARRWGHSRNDAILHEKKEGTQDA